MGKSKCFIKLWIDGDKDHHGNSSDGHEHGFGPDAEKMIKPVKHALANGEGCRVSHQDA